MWHHKKYTSAIKSDIISRVDLGASHKLQTKVLEANLLYNHFKNCMETLLRKNAKCNWINGQVFVNVQFNDLQVLWQMTSSDTHSSPLHYDT